MSLISIVTPTIAGREMWLHRSERAFAAKTPHSFEWIVIHDKPTCGIAWNEGLEQVKGGYVLIAADDLEPVDSYWADVGIACIEQNFLPCARVLRPDGSLESCGNDSVEALNGTPAHLARVPFFPQELIPHIAPIIETHYFTDDFVSWRAEQVGWPTQVARDFAFYHHYVQVGRNEARYEADRAEFEKRVLGEETFPQHITPSYLILPT